MKMLYACTGMSISLAILFFMGFRINTTHSMPTGLYQIAGEAMTVQHGDFVQLCLAPHWSTYARNRGYIDAGSCPDGSSPLLKQVAGLEGDYIIMDAEGLRLNNECLSLNTRDSKGRVLPATLSGSIPAGMAFVRGLSQDSFDSRYFGLVPLSQLRMVRSIFTLTFGVEYADK